MKKIFTLLFVLFLGLILTACGGKKKEQNLFNYNIINELPDKEITISFWHSFGDDKAALIQSYIDEFEEQYSNVTVEFTKEGNNYDELRDKVINNIRTGTTPTLVFTYPDHVADYLEGEAALALDPFIEDEKVGMSETELADFVQAYLDENHQTGHYMGLPFNKSTEVLIYNKTYFEANKGKEGFTKLTEMYNKLNPESGNPQIVTWDLIKAVALEIKADTNAWGFAYDSKANLFITLIRQHGGQYTNSKGEILFKNEITEQALQMYKDMYTAGAATLPIQWEQDYASTPFINKQVYMTVGSTAGINYNVPKDKSFEIGVAPIPQKDLNNKAVIQQGTNITMMANSTDEERLAAWLLIKHLTSKDVQIEWSMNSGYLPNRKSALESATYQAFLNNPEEDLKYVSMASKAAYLQIDYMFYDPAFPGSSNVRRNADTAMQAALFGTKSIKQVIEDAYNDLNW